MPPGDVIELLGRRLVRLSEQRAEIRTLINDTVAGGVHPLFLVEEDYRLALRDAEASFVERFVDQITDPQTGWRARWAEFHDRDVTTDERQDP